MKKKGRSAKGHNTTFPYDEVKQRNHLKRTRTILIQQDHLPIGVMNEVEWPEIYQPHVEGVKHYLFSFLSEICIPAEHEGLFRFTHIEGKGI